MGVEKPGRKSYTWLGAADRERVRDRIRAGDRVLDIMVAFDIGKSTVHRIRDETALRDARRSHSGFRLTYEERLEIEVRTGHGEGVCAVARALGRSPSTVSRELDRNGGREGYRTERAERRAQACARRPKEAKLAGCPRLRAEVEARLGEKWSPRQISCRLKVDHPDDPVMRISHETIYRSLYVQARGSLRGELCACLRTGRKRRRQQGQEAPRGRIAGMVPIAQRPPEADDRRVPGHWEGDLIIGAAGRSAVVTLVERQTRFVLLGYLGYDDRTTDHVIAQLQARIEDLPAHLWRSLTWDQGKELAAHKRFTIETGIDVFFCDPHSPWQRGSNENTNGLLRQYLPKGTDIAVCDQDGLDRIAAELNGRPRETLGWMTPAEKMAELLEVVA